MADFNIAVELVLKHEGGYVDDPNDPGGETNFGISKRAHPDLDIKNLTREQAVEIYEKEYWNPIYGQLNFQELANQLLDFGVNAGTHTAVTLLQEHVLYSVSVDGILNDNQVAAANSQSFDDCTEVYALERIRHYSKLKNFDRYAAGWVRRALDY